MDVEESDINSSTYRVALGKYGATDRIGKKFAKDHGENQRQPWGQELMDELSLIRQKADQRLRDVLHRQGKVVYDEEAKAGRWKKKGVQRLAERKSTSVEETNLQKEMKEYTANV